MSEEEVEVEEAEVEEEEEEEEESELEGNGADVCGLTKERVGSGRRGGERKNSWRGEVKGEVTEI